MRFNNLTVARFVAAFMVFVHHSSPVEYAAVQSTFWKNVASNAYVGASFFFIVSGFVLAASSLDKLAIPSVQGSVSFYWKRLARIVPLWALVASPMILTAMRANDPFLFPFLTFTQAWSASAYVAFGLLGVAWTLSVEMFFYFLFPFIAVALRPFRGASTGPVLVAVGMAIPIAGALYYMMHPAAAALPFTEPNSSHRWLYRFPPARLGEFIAGIGIFLTISRGGFQVGRRAASLILAAACVGLVFTMSAMPIGGYLWVAPSAVLFSVIVLALARLETLGLSIKHRILLLLGEASYAFYLVHQFYFKAALLPTLTTAFGLPVAQVAVLLIAVATSIGLFVAFEVPMRDLLVPGSRRPSKVEIPPADLAPSPTIVTPEPERLPQLA